MRSILTRICVTRHLWLCCAGADTLSKKLISSMVKEEKYVASNFVFNYIFNMLYSTLLHLSPSDSNVSEDAEIEPRTVATVALTVRRSNHSAKSHPQTKIFLY
jgi:hypothetical protein